MIIRLGHLAGENQAKFARLLDVPQQTLHNYLARGRSPSADFLYRVQQRLGISIDWLFTGQGEMYLPEDRRQAQSLMSPLSSIPVHDPEIKELVEWAHESEAVRGVILYLKDKEIRPFAAKELPGVAVDPRTGEDMFFAKGRGAEVRKDFSSEKKGDQQGADLKRNAG